MNSQNSSLVISLKFHLLRVSLIEFNYVFGMIQETIDLKYEKSLNVGVLVAVGDPM